jgi:hypothetical protein
MSLDPWYVTGFLEREGTFTYNRTGSGGKNLILVFGVKLGSKDLPILEELRDFFAVGQIYPVRAGQNNKASGYYRVSRLSELSAVIDHFEQYPLRGAKQRSFHIWREMVSLKQDTFRKPPLDQLNELARQLSAASPRNEAEAGPSLEQES